LGSEPPTYVLDANILIDYQGVDLSIFSLAAEHLGRLLVPRDIIIDEVADMTPELCKRHNITCIDPTLAYIALAQATNSALSFYDLLFFALAQDENAICVTNDQRLRNHCQEHGLELCWGLQLMVELVDARVLERQRAIEVATEICRQNPTLSDAILRRFCVAVGGCG